MSLRRSTRVPKPKAIWEAKPAPFAAFHTETTAESAETVQETAPPSTTLHPVSETDESNDDALFDGERDFRAPTATWKGKGTSSTASKLKITKKNARTASKTALRPITVGPLPKAVGLIENELPDLPDYESPLNLQFQASQSLATGLSELATFQRIFSQEIVDKIVFATNSYAKRARKVDVETGISFGYPRPWKPVDSIDIWRFIGSLFYMGYQRLQNHEKH